MTKIDSLLYEALLNAGHLGREILEPLAREAESQGQPLAFLLSGRGLIPEQEVLKTLSRELNIPYLDLKSADIAKAVLDKVSLKIALYYKFMPVELNNRVLTAAVAYPLDVKIQDEIRTQLGYDITMVLSPSGDIQEALKKRYGLGAETIERIASGGGSGKATLETVSLEAVEDIEKQASDASVINLVNQIILEGWKKRATDIHIEPFRGGVGEAVPEGIIGGIVQPEIGTDGQNFLTTHFGGGIRDSGIIVMRGNVDKKFLAIFVSRSVY